MKRQALRCARCNKPIRKGTDVMVTEFCIYEGINAEGQRVMARWFIPNPVIRHMRCSQGGITAAELRRLKAEA